MCHSISCRRGAKEVPLEALDHYTIQCTDLEATRDFYRDVLGLTVGPRPNFGFAGYWLFCGDVPVVHLLGADGALPENRRTDIGDRTGALDHIAFRATGLRGMLEHLKREKVPFTQRRANGQALFQLFLLDPNGIKIELNYAAEEAEGIAPELMASELIADAAQK